ncbi:diguanylate cyclase domain-containing protein [Thiohalospira sp.]|uniref:diguanylate cyclase domain-containing protein n=1 Tax=Thiohalospira sp. TaxID=3080549 RepID=UPI003980FFD1
MSLPLPTADAATADLLEDLACPVVLLDAEGRIRHLSEAAARLFRVSPASRLAGESLGAVLECPRGAGVAEWLAGGARRSLRCAAREAFGGFTTTLRATPLAPGEGWLASLGDVAAAGGAADRLRLADAVFAHSGQGIMVTDARARILDVNPAFEELTGYRRDEVIDHNPSILSSGRQGPGFYAELWGRLQQAGRWEGEIWNRRKDGTLYAEWLTITAVRDEAGAVVNYVGVFSDITAVKQDQDRLARMAYHDPLTGLPNRALILDRLEHALAAARRDGTNVAVIYLDLDGFKPINDDLGHATGDALLEVLAQRFSSCVRGADTVGRMGGDEFVILLEGVQGHRGVERVVACLLEAASQPVEVEGIALRLSASIGVRMVLDGNQEPEELLAEADAAMYEAKGRGRNRRQFFSPAMGRRRSERSQAAGTEDREAGSGPA